MIKVIVRKSDKRIMNFNETGHGTFDWSNNQFKEVEIPDQDVDQFYEQTEAGETLKEIYYPDDVQTQFDSPFLDPTAEYDAKVIEIDPSHGKKVLKVEREINGQTVSAWCYASGTLYHQYQAGEFDVGNRVVISFVRKSLEYPWAQDRVYKF